MAFEEDGERIQDLKLILQRVAYAAMLFDDDGIQLRFINNQPPFDYCNGIRTEQQIDQLIQQHEFKGLTAMGTELKKKVIDGIVLDHARQGRMQKPVLCIVITDGQPAGEAPNAVFDAVRYATTELSRMPQYGPGAIAFQFAQVGNDTKAREFLSRLDSDPQVGDLVDVTSSMLQPPPESYHANLDVQITSKSPPRWPSNSLLSTSPLSFGSSSFSSALLTHHTTAKTRSKAVQAVRLAQVNSTARRQVNNMALLREDSTVSLLNKVVMEDLLRASMVSHRSKGMASNNRGSMVSLRKANTVSLHRDSMVSHLSRAYIQGSNREATQAKAGRHREAHIRLSKVDTARVHHHLRDTRISAMGGSNK